jgi:DNA polymerase I-like protein with 3'-5' exonuclease and polymerase domains
LKIQPASPAAMELFLKGQQVLARIEANGIRVDVPRLTKTLTDIETGIADQEELLRKDEVFAAWKARFGPKTNLGSLPQLGEVLFDCLKIPYTFERTATDRYKTDAETLAKVDHPFVKAYSKLGDLTSIRGKLKGIQRELCNGRIHPSFNLASGEEDKGGGARSFRGSSSAPNAQNFPVRDPFMAKLIRPLFVPEPGDLWVESDYTGNEVKSACCYTKDPRLIDEFTSPGKDPHGDTGMELFFLKKDEVERKTVRDASKNQFVFPQFFGSVWFQCAPPIWERMQKEQWKVKGSDEFVIDRLKKNGVTKLGRCEPGKDPDPGSFGDHVRKVEDAFWNKRFKVYTEWKKKTWRDYQEKGYITYLTGFVASGHMRRNQVLNYAIQGTAFHWLLQYLIWLQESIDKYRMRTRITSQIHDSANKSVPPRELEDVLEITHDIVTKRMPRKWKWIIVPQELECEASPPDSSWYDKKLIHPMVAPRPGASLAYLQQGGWQWQ